MASKTYVYQDTPLSGAVPIRLMKILPAEPGLPLQCTLECFDLEAQALKYTALSYTWGRPDDGFEIELNGQSFLVRENLYSALLQFRENGLQTFLWADAVCIDQDNIPERNEQVRTMGQFYARASQVIVWLGPQTDGECDISEINLDIIPGFVKLCENRFFNATCLDLVEFTTSEHQGRFCEGLVQFTRILSHPYWRRIWVVPELLLAKDLNVVCGSQSLHWSYFTRLLSYESVEAWPRKLIQLSKIYDGEGGDVGFEHSMNSPSAILVLLQQFIRSFWVPSFLFKYIAERHLLPETGLFSLWLYFKGWGATDPKDRIYALLGLCDASTQAAISVDYGSPPEFLNLSVASLMIRHGKLNDLFYFNTGCGSKRTLHTQPSWVIDFLGSDRFQHGRYRPSMHTTLYGGYSSVLGTDSVNLQRDLLNVDGVVLDAISEHMPGPEIMINNHSKRPLSSFIREWEKVATKADSMHPYPSGCTLFEAFWRTMYLDLDPYEFMYDAHRLEDYPDKNNIFLPPDTRNDPDLVEKVEEMGMNAREKLKIRAFFTTKSGYMGIGPPFARPGDKVCVLFGVHMPFVLREAGDGLHTVVGECYMHGVMDGEAVKDVNEGRREITRLTLR